MIRQPDDPNMSPREKAQFDWEKEATRLQIAHAERISEMNLEVRKLEARWSSLFRLPMAIIWLPIRLVVAFAIPIAAITKKDLPKEFWEFIRG